MGKGSRCDQAVVDGKGSDGLQSGTDTRHLDIDRQDKVAKQAKNITLDPRAQICGMSKLLHLSSLSTELQFENGDD